MNYTRNKDPIASVCVCCVCVCVVCVLIIECVCVCCVCVNRLCVCGGGGELYDLNSRNKMT